MKIFFLFILCLLISISSFGQTLPFRNPDLGSEERAKDLILRLTLEDKATLMCDIFNEPEYPLVITDLEAWLEAHMKYGDIVPDFYNKQETEKP